MMVQLLKADRCECNECSGKDVDSCLAIDDLVICYFPTARSRRYFAQAIAKAVEPIALQFALQDMVAEQGVEDIQ